MQEGSGFSTSNTYFLFVFGNSLPNLCEVVCHNYFDLHFSSDWWCVFSCAYWLFICLLREKCLIKFFVHFWIELVVLYCWVAGVLIFWILVPYKICDLQTFSPNLFTFLIVLLEVQKFNFDEILFIFCRFCLCFWYHI